MSDTEYRQKRTNIKNELELVDYHLKNVLNDSELKNSNEVIELQVARLKLLDKLRHFRPSQAEDISYRKAVFENFPSWATKNIPESMHLLFHGTTLSNTERIINSGRITSGKDRWGIYTSGDTNGEISVSTKDFLEISMQYYMNLMDENGFEYCLPCGSLFVFKANPEEYKNAKRHYRANNVYLKKNPDQLYAVITTPENLKRVKWWMEKNGLPSEKVMNFESFQEKINSLPSRQVAKKEPSNLGQTILKERT